MPNEEEKKVGIPESITINGVTYLVKETPELQQFIQQVSKVEKSKLYTQYENLRTQIQNLGREQVQNETPQLDLNALAEKLSATFVTKEDMKIMLPDVVKNVIQPVLNATEENRQNELKAYREKLIQENIATCIPDLVTGNSKEELDATLKKSIQLRASYPTPSTVHTQGQPVKDPLIAAQATAMEQATPTPTPSAPTAPAPQAQPPVQIPTAPRRPSPEVSAPRSAKNMPMSEFEAKRASLLAELEATYGA